MNGCAADLALANADVKEEKMDFDLLFGGASGAAVEGPS